MQSDLPKGPFCQSCGMPMEKADDFGTLVDGTRINDYCHFCFTNGLFIEPEITLAQMISKVSGIMSIHMNIPEEDARLQAESLIPTLKRWKTE